MQKGVFYESIPKRAAMVAVGLGSDLPGDPSDDTFTGNDRKFSLATNPAGFATFSAIPVITLVTTLTVGGPQAYRHPDSQATRDQDPDQNANTHALTAISSACACFAQSPGQPSAADWAT